VSEEASRLLDRHLADGETPSSAAVLLAAAVGDVA
jgi:hypothetical protein